METTVRNKKVVLRDYMKGLPQESDLIVVTDSDSVELKVKPGSATILVKNLYLSCDPYMGILMKVPTPSTAALKNSFVPGKPIAGVGVSKVIDSDDPDFAKGDFVMHGRSKHIGVRYHFLRDLTKQGIIKLVYCNTEDQLPDMMTKPLKHVSFKNARAAFGMFSLSELNLSES